MKSYAIFLRGVTPVGKNRVPMAELRAALAKAGLCDVRTYIQSGNVIAKSALGPDAIEALVHEVILKEIGADLAVVARTHPQIQRILENNPFPADAASRTYYTLFAAAPAGALVRDLLALDFAPDAVRVIGDTLYTLYATRHSDSKFNNNFYERKLKMAATTRNFNTLSRLLKLSAEIFPGL